MENEFKIHEYKIGDTVRIFDRKEDFTVFLLPLNKRYYVLGKKSHIVFELHEAHMWRIKSVVRNKKIIAKRKSCNYCLHKIQTGGQLCYKH